MTAAPRPPDFLIVGQAKSGTTALYEMLRQHPAIFMPARKEPMFYCSDEVADPHRARVLSRADYLELFAPAAGRLAGEGSTTYVWAATAPARIAADRPDARIIVLLRDPATFVVSVHGELVQRGYETEPDLERALALEPLRRRDERVPASAPRPRELWYSERVRYANQLERWLAHFPRERVLVLVYEDFRADNAATLRRIFGFLGVDPDFTPSPSRANPSRGLRSAATRDAVRWATHGQTPIARAGRRVVKTLTPERARRGAAETVLHKLAFGRPPDVDPALMRRLRTSFAPEVQALERLLGSAPTSWPTGG